MVLVGSGGTQGVGRTSSYPPLSLGVSSAARGCLPSRQVVGSRSPQCPAGLAVVLQTLHEVVEVHKHSFPSPQKLPERLPQQPSLPTSRTQQACPALGGRAPRNCLSEGPGRTRPLALESRKKPQTQVSGTTPSLQPLSEQYLSTECSGWCFLYVNLYSNCSSFDRKNRAHFVTLLP